MSLIGKCERIVADVLGGTGSASVVGPTHAALCPETLAKPVPHKARNGGIRYAENSRTALRRGATVHEAVAATLMSMMAIAGVAQLVAINAGSGSPPSSARQRCGRRAT